MFDPIAQAELDKLWELRRKLAAAAREVVTSGDTAVTRFTAFVTTELGDRWEATAPRLTGTLASATRERIEGGEGKVFIDPSVVNPVFGGYPAVYGVEVHDRKPWVEILYTQGAQSVLVEGGQKFFGEFDRIFTT